MKKVKAILFTFLLSASVGIAQEFSPMDKSPADIEYFPTNAAKRHFAGSEVKQAALAPKIKIVYSRPSKKDRTIFGELVAYNKPWRAGANEAPDVLLYEDITWGDTPVKAGRYSLFIIPTEDNWTVVLSTQLDTWGSYTYDEKQNIASITVPTQESKAEIEEFSIVLYEKANNVAHLKMGWDKTIVEVPITF